MPPEIVKELPLAPALSATSDDPRIDEKIAAANAPALSVSSDNGPVGEVAAPGDTPESVKAAEAAKEAAKKQAEGEAKPPGSEEETKDTKEHKEDTTPPWMKAFISKTKNAEAEAKREAAQARREASEARAQLAQVLERVVPAQAAPVAPPEPQPPNEAAFEDPAAYHRAYVDYADKRAEWKAERKAEEKVAAFRKETEAANAKREAERLDAEMNAFIERGRAKYEDWSEKCEVDGLPITPFMYEAAKDADNGEDVIYYLGDNPKEARRIAALKPVQQIRAIAKIETQVAEAAKAAKDEKPKDEKPKAETPKAPAPKEPSKAPAPITPVGASNVVEKTPEQMSTMEYITKRRREEAAKKGIILP
jgi:hypothetical protein